MSSCYAQYQNCLEKTRSRRISPPAEVREVRKRFAPLQQLVRSSARFQSSSQYGGEPVLPETEEGKEEVERQFHQLQSKASKLSAPQQAALDMVSLMNWIHCKATNDGQHTVTERREQQEILFHFGDKETLSISIHQ